MTDQTNHLEHETSPYLRQHIHNPVDWYPWGELAFEKAKKEDKPIFLSIGYSTCHWCHVMAHESFEDPQIAKYLNEHYVCIKLDREERPDIDHIFQYVVQMMGKSGGWPLSIFLTPDMKPFFGGTYFPKRERFGMIGFLDLIQRIYVAFNQHRNEIDEAGERVIEALSDLNSKIIPYEPESSKLDITENIIDLSINNIRKEIDLVNGGFGTSPKFPEYPALMFLIRQAAEFEKKNPEKYQNIKKFLQLTLTKMADGGIYDHIGGGFSRYSVDDKWNVPHFEKMLYDNAMALSVYSEAYKIFRIEHYKNITREIIEWLKKEMYHKDIGFYSAIDADSDGSEGKFYVWSKNELDSIISNDDRFLFFKAYGITTAGNFEHELNVLNRVMKDEELAKEFGLNQTEIQEKLAKIKETLFLKREQRIHPFKDTKILVSWNSLLVNGLYPAYSILKDDKIKIIAHSVLDFIRKVLYDEKDKILYEVYDPQSNSKKNIGTLETYAYFIQALFTDQIYYPNDSNFVLIKDLLDSVSKQFLDKDDRIFYLSSNLRKDLLTRIKGGSDMPIPAPNGVMIENQLQYYYFMGEQSLLKDIELGLRSYIPQAIKTPSMYGAHLMALQWYLYGNADIAVIFRDEIDISEFSQLISNYFIPRLHLQISNLERLSIAQFKEKGLLNQKNTFYICYNFKCDAPTNDKDIFIASLNSHFLKFS